MNKNKVLLAFALLSLVVLRASSQATYSAPRINAAVNDSVLTVLHGNTYPLAVPQFDHGPAPAALPLQHMLLVLKRSPAQEAALEAFMAEQLDPSSANYHHWLTPTEFGQMYGPAQQDVDVVTKWLQTHGFQVNNVANGRTTIDFSGNVAQVQSAFHTAIHQYVVKGEQHWANATDPSIPTALTPVVAGVRSLNNFYPKPMARKRLASVHPGFTFNPGGCDIAGSNSECFTVGPNDFSTIYNVGPLYNDGIDGSGETIAIVGDSNINLQDVAQFRQIFGLSANVPNVIEPDGAVTTNSDEIEAALDTEWSGAVARNATIDLVIAPSSANGVTFGGDIAAAYIINYPNATHTNTSAGLAPILSESFGACEFDLGTSGNAFYNTEWQQAAAEGITVLVASGDQSAASCDVPAPGNPPGCGGFSSNTLLQTARCGLAVNGVASTPYNIAVGGTDFNDLGVEGNYWNTTPGAQSSALGYVPEDVWNDTCTNSILFDLVSVSPPITNGVESCSDASIQAVGESETPLVEVAGSGGGVSNCTNGATSISGCSGGNAQPTWQNGVAGVQGTTRNMPDVSLFAGDGLVGHFYVMCEEDIPEETDQFGDPVPGTGQSGGACTLGASPVFVGVGGTSVSVQAFAGIMALVDQKHNSKQGNAGSVLYPMAAQAGASCTSAGSPASTCKFYDIIVGTNSTPCTIGSIDCTTTASLPGIFARPLSPTVVRAIRIFCALGIGLLLLLGLRRKQARWVTAAALCGTAALLLVSVGCGGGGSSSGTGTGSDEGTPEGILTGYNAGAGFDLATGLGSVNATNVVDSTMWAGVAPAAPPATIDRPTITAPVAALAIVCALCLGFLFAGLRRRQLRWTTAVLLLAFALSILSAARTSASPRPHHPVSRAPSAMRLASWTASHR